MNIKKIASIGLALTLAASAVSAKTKYISPNNDGVQDELSIPVKISDKRFIQGWSLIIENADGEVVRRIGNKVTSPETINVKNFFKQLAKPKDGIPIPDNIVWNGVGDDGETVADGAYYYYLTAEDDNGNVSSSKKYKVIVDTVAPQVVLASIADKTFGEGSKISLKISQDGSIEDLWTGVLKSADGTIVKTYEWKESAPSELSWFGTDNNGRQVSDGVYSYEISAKDRAGNVAPETVLTNIIYSANKPVTNIYIESLPYLSPETDSTLQNVFFSLTIPVPDARTGNSIEAWEVAFEGKDGKVVRTYNLEKDGAVPPSTIVFDGRDNDGKILPDGEYRASVTAKYSNGYVPTKLSTAAIKIDTKRPSANIVASGDVFGGKEKPTVQFKIGRSPDDGAPIPEWNGAIKSEDGLTVVKSYKFGEFPPETIIWNGLTDEGVVADNGSYVFEMSSTDMAGNASEKITSKVVRFDHTEAELMISASETFFSPNADNVKDTITFTPVTSTKDILNYEFEIVEKLTGKKVYTLNGERSIPAKIVWDGKGDDKMIAVDGVYIASLSLHATNGNNVEAYTQEFVLDTIYPSLVAEIPYSTFSPDGDKDQDIIPVTIKNSTSENLWTAEVRDFQDKLVKKYTWRNTSSGFVWDGTDESGNLASDGTFSIIIYSTDDSGNSFSTEIKEIVLDSRETKAYLTAEYEGISPNGDGTLDTQQFEIKTTVPDGIKSWKFTIVSSEGQNVYTLTEKDSDVLPSTIIWNGADKDGNVAEGTFTGTLAIDYVKGNKINVVSTPFICTATPPQVRVQTAPEYFSPDNDGVDDDLYIRLSGSTKAKIASWSFTISDPRGNPFWKTNGGTSITERIVWDGLSNTQKDASGNAERVQSATDYPYTFIVTDNLGMTSVAEGIISVDVLVIREGNVLKMAVPSIIFESDAANFQTENAKLAKDKISKNIATLNRIAEILKKFKDYKVEIVGHANRITNPYNDAEETEDNPKWGRASIPLSKERAEEIKKYLVKHGVNASNVTTDGKGGTQPVTDPYDRDNNWKNRRVEFILVK